MADGLEPPVPSKLIESSPQAQGVFVLQADGTIRHVQSGLVCRPNFNALKLAHLEVFESQLGKGADVGCDYGRFNAKGEALSKLTIFVTRASPGETVDQVLDRRRAEVRENMPDAKETGPALDIQAADPKWRGVRSAEYAVKFGQTRYLSDVIVAVQNGWEIEIRGTYPIDIVSAPNADPKQVADQFDAPGPAVALADALGSVGSSPTP
jgi:hypothetical protein